VGEVGVGSGPGELLVPPEFRGSEVFRAVFSVSRVGSGLLWETHHLVRSLVQRNLD
jgi:hypothetical protein